MKLLPRWRRSDCASISSRKLQAKRKQRMQWAVMQTLEDRQYLMGSPSLYAPSAHEVDLSWSCGDSATFTVQRSTGDDSNFGGVNDVGGNTSWSDTGVSPNTLYFYRIIAHCTDQDNNTWDDYGDEASITTPDETPQTYLSSPSAWAPSDYEVDLNWSATGIDYFEVDRSTDGSNYDYLWSGGDTSYADTSVQPNTTYYYRVQGGGLTSDSTNITVPHHPSATFSPSSSSPDPNTNVTFSFTNPSDPISTTYSYSYNFGSGFESGSDTKVHAFDSAGTYTVTGRITNSDNYYADYPLTITVNGITASGSFYEGGTVYLGVVIPSSWTNPTYQWSATNAPGWNTGSSTGNSKQYNPTDDGDAVVSLHVTADGGVDHTYTRTVHINDVAPTANLAATGPINEGSSATVGFTSPYDPSSVDTSAGFHYSIATNPSLLANSYAAATDPASKSFSFADNGYYTVYGRIFDQDGNYTPYSTTVTVNNVAPSNLAVTLAPSTVARNASTILTGSFSDPGTADPHQVVINWGDGASTTLNLAAGVLVIPATSHQYTATGTRTVQVTVSDTGTDDSGSVSTTTTATVVAALATLSAQPSSANRVDLTYTSVAGVQLELEQAGPGDFNYHTVAFTPNYTSGSHTFSVNGLQSSSHYNFRLKVLQNGLVQYVNAFATTPAGSISLGTPTSLAWNTSTHAFTFSYTSSNAFDVTLVSYSSAQPLPLFNSSPYSQPFSFGANGSPSRTINNVTFPTYMDQVELRVSSGSYVSQWAPLQLGSFAVPPSSPNISLSASSASGSVTFSLAAATSCTIYGITSDNQIASLGSISSGTSLTVTASSIASNVLTAIAFDGSNYSNLIAVPGRTPSAPLAPGNLTFTPHLDGSGQPQALLAWDNNSNNETGFLLQRKDLSANAISSTWVDLATLSADQTSYTDNITAQGGAYDVYDYRVLALNGGSISRPSNVLLAWFAPLVSAVAVYLAKPVQGLPVTLSATAAPTAINGDSLSYQWTVKDSQNNTISLPNSGVTTAPALTFTPSGYGSGWSISLTVTDSVLSLSTTVGPQSFNVASAPPLQITGPSITSENVAVSYTATASANWTVTKGATTVATGSGVHFSFTPSDSGAYSIQAVAGSNTASVSLSVNHMAPTVSISGPAVGFAGRTLTFAASVQQAPGSHDSLSYYWELLNADGSAASVTLGSRKLSTLLVPGSLSAGSYAVRLTVVDRGITQKETFAFTVLAAPASSKFDWGAVPAASYLEQYPDDFIGNPGVTQYSHAIVQQADGKLVVAVQNNAVWWNGGSPVSTVGGMIARFNPDLTLDTSFGPDHRGVITTSFSSIQSLALDPTSGAIIAVGDSVNYYSSGVGYRQLAVGRYLGKSTYLSSQNKVALAGSFDPSFNGGQLLLIGNPSTQSTLAQATTVTVLSDSSILIGGTVQTLGTTSGSGSAKSIVNGAYSGQQVNTLRVSDFLLTKLTSAGQLDTSFGPNSNGMAAQAVVEALPAQAPLVWQSDSVLTAATGWFALGGGQMADGTAVKKLIVLSNGQILAVGYATRFARDGSGNILYETLSGYPNLPLTDTGLALVRYNSDGSIDSNFGASGLTFTSSSAFNKVNNNPTADGAVYPGDARISSSGTIMVGALASPRDVNMATDPTAQVVLAKYTSSGTLSSAINNTGVTTATPEAIRWVTNRWGELGFGYNPNTYYPACEWPQAVSGSTSYYDTAQHPVDVALAFQSDDVLVAAKATADTSMAPLGAFNSSLVKLSTADGTPDTLFGGSGGTDLPIHDISGKAGNSFIQVDGLQVFGNQILAVGSLYGLLPTAATNSQNSAYGFSMSGLVRYSDAASTTASGLTATASPAGGVALAWSNTGFGQEGFEIRRNDGTNTDVIGVVGPDQRSFLDSTAAANAAYSYQVYPFYTTTSTQYGTASSSVSVRTFPAGSKYELKATATVPVDGSTVTSSYSLQSGQMYLLVASGHVHAHSSTGGGDVSVIADARYWYSASDAKAFGTVLGDADFGIGITSGGSNTVPAWGPADPADHSYSYLITGQGSALTFQFHDAAYGDNSVATGDQALQVQIYLVTSAPSSQSTAVLHIASPAPSSLGAAPVISANTPVTIAANPDAASASWTLWLTSSGQSPIRLASSDQTTLTLSNVPITAVILNPALYADGSYVLALTSTTGSTYSSGDVVDSTPIIIQSAMKSGALTLPATDASFTTPLGSMSLTRIYNSFRANQPASSTQAPGFGPGWTLSLLDAQLHVAAQADTYASSNTRPALRAGDLVYLTSPDGVQHVFEFAPLPYSTDSATYGGNASGLWYSPRFIALDGSGATLTLSGPGHCDPVLMYDAIDNEYILPGASPVGFNPAVAWNDPWRNGSHINFDYVLTSGNLSYRIDSATGQIKAVADAAGNALTFTTSGSTITATFGESSTVLLTIQTESYSGGTRIASIFVPGQNPIQYSYDSSGNLVSVQNQTFDKSFYLYQDAARAHNLTGAIDAGGKLIVEALYDQDNGQLQALVNSVGVVVPVTSAALGEQQVIETVVDGTGQITDNLYDEAYGYIIRKIQTVTNDTDDVLYYLVSASQPSYVIDAVPGGLGVHVLQSVREFAPFQVLADDDAGLRYTLQPKENSWTKQITYDTSIDLSDPARGQALSISQRIDDAHSDEVQRLSVASTPTSGHYTLSYYGQTTSQLQYNASAATVQSALRALTGLESVTVSGTALDSTHHFDITFVGIPGVQPLLEIGSSTLNDGSGAVTTTVAVQTPYTGPTLQTTLSGNYTVVNALLELAKPRLVTQEIQTPSASSSSGYADHIQNKTYTAYNANGDLLYSLVTLGSDPNISGNQLAEGGQYVYTTDPYSPPGQVTAEQSVVASISSDGVISGSNHTPTVVATRSQKICYDINDIHIEQDGIVYQEGVAGAAYGMVKYDTDASLQRTWYAYDGQGNVILQYTYKTWTDGGGNSVSGWVGVTNAYNSLGQLTDTWQATYRDTSTGAGGTGNHILHTLAGGPGDVSVIIVDTGTNAHQTVYAAPVHTVHKDYDTTGHLMDSIDVYGGMTSYTYDAAGHVIRTVNPDGTEVRTVYDERGRKIWETDKYASNGDPSDTNDPALATYTIYNKLGQVVETRRYSGVVITVTSSMHGSVAVAKSQVANLDAILGSPGQSPLSSSYKWYDEQGRVIETKDESGLRMGTIFYPDGRTWYSGPLTDDAPDGGYEVTDAAGLTRRAFELADFVSYTTDAYDQAGSSVVNAAGPSMNIQLDNDGVHLDIYYVIDSTPVLQRLIDLDDLASMVINAQGATITIGEEGTTLNIPGTIRINAGSGGTLNVIGDTTLTLDSNFGDDLGRNLTLSVADSAEVNFAQRQDLRELDLTDTGRVNLLQANVATGSAQKVLVLGSLSIGSSAVLDVGNNDLIVHNGSETGLTSLLHSGLVNNTGIISSCDSSYQSLMRMGLKPGSASQSFAGYTLVGGDILLKFTYVGDVNLDTVVNSADFNIISMGYYNGGDVWYEGDVNYDGVVNSADSNLASLAYYNQVGTYLSPTTSGNNAVAAGQVYTLSLSPGTSQTQNVSGWTIYWGDGSWDVVSGNPSSASHIYGVAGSYVITAAARSQRLGFYAANKNLEVGLPAGVVSFDAVTDALGHVTRTYKDAKGRTIRTTYDDGSFTETLYSIAGQAVSKDEEGVAISNPSSGEGWSGIATEGQEVVSIAQRKSGDSRVITYKLYNLAEQLTDVWLPAVTDADPNSSTYNQSRRPHWHYAYDTAGDESSETDPKGHTTTIGYNQDGNQVRRTLPDNTSETSTYDAFGRALTDRDYRGQTTAYAYDPDPAHGGREAAKYRFAAGVAALDGQGNILTANASEETAYGYDNLGRQISVTEYAGGNFTTPVRTEVTAYDPYGSDAVAEEDSPEGKIHHAYDPATAFLTDTWTGDTSNPAAGATHVIYGYDDQSRLASVTSQRLNGVTQTAPSGVYRYTINGATTAAEGPTTFYTYDAAGNLESVTDPNAMVTTYGYDDLNRLDHEIVTCGSRNIFEQTYALADDGQRTQVIEKRWNNAGTSFSTTKITWEYDDDGRLVQEKRDEGNDNIVNGNDYTASFAFDLAGNRVSKVQTGYQAASTTYVYDNCDELTSETTGGTTTNYGYDANGSMTSSGTATFGYDLRGRMTSAAVGGTTTNYGYDSEGVRVSGSEGTSSAYYLNDALNPTGYNKAIEEYDGSTLSRSYVFGLDIIAQTDAGCSSAYFLKDGHGTTRALLDGSALVLTGQAFDFDAFGGDVGSFTADTDWLAPDGRTDAETSFVYSLGRYRAGWRFVSADDPRYGNPNEPMSLHAYLYASGNPISGTDSSGHFSLPDIMASVGIGDGVDAMEGGSVWGIVSAVTSSLKGSVALFNAMQGGFINATMSDGDFVGHFAVGFASSLIQSTLSLAGVPCPVASAFGGAALQFGNDYLAKGSQAFSWEELGDVLQTGIVASLFGCFVADAPVLLGDGTTQVAIEQIHVGERVATDGGVANSADGKTATADPNATEVDPTTWRLVTIEANDWEVQTLEPISWIDAHGVADGASLRLADVVDVAEMGVPDDLTGTVESISACPPIQGGLGRVVTTTMSHLSDFLFNLTLSDNQGDTENLSVTGYHRFYTEDRGWAVASDLYVGEEIRGAHGDVHVISLARDPGTYRVYNMTVEDDHVYYVGDFTALVHNACNHVDGGTATADQALEGAAKFLGPGYKDMGLGRFLSADGLRQIRMGLHELVKMATHMHFEHFDVPGGKIIESTFTKII